MQQETKSVAGTVSMTLVNNYSAATAPISQFYILCKMFIDNVESFFAHRAVYIVNACIQFICTR